jgi:SSS family transporter
MNWIDWLVMLATLIGIAAYGVWRTRHVRSSETHMRGNQDLLWWVIGFNIMATQASAITFLSLPGQAYEDGMRFVQFYFGLPLAMIFLSIFVIPYYYRFKIYTAYEYLENRFGVNTRVFTALLFLIQRGFSTGISFFAPSIVMSELLGWSLNFTILFICGLILTYTYVGGSKAVSYTQTLQFSVIWLGLFLAAGIVFYQLPPDVQFMDAVNIAGKMGKLNLVDFKFDLSSRYNIWSGVIGGAFLAISYFGTDQSQVARYLGGKSLSEGRLGLMLNGLIKVPMQFFILAVGVLVFVFYLFNPSPLHFNSNNVNRLSGSAAEQYHILETQQQRVFEQRRSAANDLMLALREGDQERAAQAEGEVKTLHQTELQLREDAKTLIKDHLPSAVTKDTDYVFITYVLNFIPVGVIGLLLAMILAAACSSGASAINALATTTVVDIYQRLYKPEADDRHYLRMSKLFVAVWSLISLAFAFSAQLFDNLIQAVNIIGSIFYGVILGVFLTAFFQPKVKGRAVFIAAILTQIIVIVVYAMSEYKLDLKILGWVIPVRVAYLWLNLIGCLLVMGFAETLQRLFPRPSA